jgi:molecular chaperone GrpE
MHEQNQKMQEPTTQDQENAQAQVLENAHPDLDACRQDLEQCRQEVAQWKERFIRMTADFDNYKRRAEKEQTSWMRSSKMIMLRSLLPVIDTVELAVRDCAQRERIPQNDSLIAGIRMMGAEFHKFLEATGVTEIQETKQFDPTLHEAIVQVETDQVPSGQIVEILQKGYLFGDQVVRPAKVSVAK